MINRRLLTVAALGAAVAIPAAMSSAAGSYQVTADADASSYATGPSTGKTWIAYPENGDTKSIRFSQPLEPQIDAVAAGTLINPAFPAKVAVGHARVYLNNSPTPLGNLVLETGKASDCPAPPAPGANIPAVASDGSPITGEMRIQTGAALATIIKANCIGVRVDATPPSLSSAGVVHLTIDITAAANVAITLGLGHITEVDLDLDQQTVTTLAGPRAILRDNPATPTTVTSTIDVTECAALASYGPCGGSGATVSGTVKETLGGTTGVTAVAGATKVTYGKPVTVTGTVTRGLTGAAETVDVFELSGPGTASHVSAEDGTYVVSVVPTVSGKLFARSYTLLDNSLYSNLTAAITVVAPKPVLSGKAVRKGTKVTVKIKGAVKGLKYTAKIGSTKLKSKTSGTTVTFTGKGKKGATVAITAAKKGITSTTLKVKLK